MTRTSMILTLAALAVAPLALAGPPLICHPLETGGAKSLPWTNTNGWDGAMPSYKLEQLIPDTMALLTPQTPVLVRMETLRRAAIYSSRDLDTGFELLSRLMARALNDQSNALAWFDAGYLAETFRQYEFVLKRKVPQEFDGYAWTKRALALGGPNPEMEYAAALIQSHTRWPNEHLAKAKTSAKPGSLLAQNLARMN